MKTLIIVAHPHIEESDTQQFLMASSSSLPNVTNHFLTDNPIDIKKEQRLLQDYERIIFQFPMYWYSAPYLLKRWLDEVFSYQFVKKALKTKELGLVVSLGVSESSFAAGMTEHYTLSELFKPFQALANKCDMIFLPIFPVTLFSYMTDVEKKQLLVRYQYYLTSGNRASFKDKEDWFISRLKAYKKKDKTEALERILEIMLDNQQSLEELELLLNEMR